MGFRIAIYDDVIERREGLGLLIDSMTDHVVVGSYNDCRDVISDLQNRCPDLILMDIDMPYVNGIDGVRLIRTIDKEVKILMQTVFEDDDKVFAAICAGADGYLLKHSDPSQLLKAMDEVMDGGAPMTPVIARKVLQLFSKFHQPKSKGDFALTKRETEILKLLVDGYSYKMIADECCISFATVNTHVNKIYRKLHVNSAPGAVSKALREGLV
jgi:DNA-binding NarL/FixJ family response regulator